MHYFSQHYVVPYDILRDKKYLWATDITRRLKLSDIFSNREYVLFNYEIPDGDRPDIVAHKVYGDSSLDWVIFLTNNILDPYFDWPLGSLDFDKFLTQKYGSVHDAMAETHHYEWITSPQNRHFPSPEGEGILLKEETILVDETTYNSLSTSERRVVSDYDYETNINEAKRNIKLLQSGVIPALKRAMTGLFK